MNNSNPFDPVTTDPAVDPPQTDGAAGDFTADDGGAAISGPNSADAAGDAAKTPRSIDGISLNYGGASAALDDDPAPDSVPVKVGPTPPPDNNLDNNQPTGNFLDDMAADDATPLAVAPITNDTAPVEPAPIEPVPTESVPTEPIPTDKPVKHVTISLLTIIFFILTLAGAGGTVYFYLQNNRNANDLANANAKVQQLKDELSTTNTTEDTSAGQYGSLNSKIEDLTKQNADKQKLLDANKAKIDDLTKQNTDLTNQVADLTKKAQNISDLTTKLDKVISNCKVTTGGTIAPCTLGVQP